MGEQHNDRATVASFLAAKIGAGSAKPVDVQQLAESISEIELETQTAGASFIKVHIVDPYYRIATEEFLDLVPNVFHEQGVTANLRERLPDIQVEFPEGSNWWWQLAAAEFTNNLTQPNIILTFEDRIVTELREQYGYKNSPAGVQTRAQFVKAMVDEANMKLRREGKPLIRFVCPKLNELQEVEEDTGEKLEKLTGRNEVGEEAGSTPTPPGFKARASQGGEGSFGLGAIAEGFGKYLSPKAKHNEKTRMNKLPGIVAGAKLTVKGQPMTPEQQETAELLLGVADEHNAPGVAVEALVYAAIGEADLTPNPVGNTAANGERYWGALSGSQQHFPNGSRENRKMAEMFLNGGLGFQGGGAIALAHAGKNDPEEIAVLVEVPSIWPENAYAAQEKARGEFVEEADAIIKAGGGVRGSLFLGSGSILGESDVGQLTRGTPNDPTESTWDCIQKLASQVRWSAFTNGLEVTTFEKGRFLYYLDGFDFIRQKPAATVDIFGNVVTNGHSGAATRGVVLEGVLGNVDNTMYEYYANHKVAGKMQVQRSAVAKPSTPAEIRLPLICEPLEYEAGDVFHIVNSGPFNGRWVVTDALRNYIKDPFTTFTLAPPLLPYPEPHAAASSIAGRTSGIQAVAEMAQKAYGEKGKYLYTEKIPNRENNGTLFGPAPREMDCSSFATLCYKEAQMPDPSGQGFAPIGNTTSMIANMVRTNNPVPGDLVFYGTDEREPAHVVVFTGGNGGIGMERPGVNLLSGPVWGAGNLGAGAGPPIGGEGHAWRLKGQYSTELKHG